VVAVLLNPVADPQQGHLDQPRQGGQTSRDRRASRCEGRHGTGPGGDLQLFRRGPGQLAASRSRDQRTLASGLGSEDRRPVPQRDRLRSERA
jgi:hypothetical protein